jgi:hypothetical protein
MTAIISVINQSSISQQEIVDFSTILHKQINWEFSAVWKTNAIIVPEFCSISEAKSWTWKLILMNHPSKLEDAGRLGLHRLDQDLVPYSVVFTELCALWGVSWEEYASHEALEMLINPQLNRYVKYKDMWYCQEICDPVYGSHYIQKSSVEKKVANFVYPSYYLENAPGPYDYLGLLKKPFSCLPTGYVSTILETSYGVTVPESAKISTNWGRLRRILQKEKHAIT